MTDQTLEQQPLTPTDIADGIRRELATIRRYWPHTFDPTSRSGAARATPAQVEAAMEALDCRREFDELTLTMFCAEHHVGLAPRRGRMRACRAGR